MENLRIRNEKSLDKETVKEVKGLYQKIGQEHTELIESQQLNFQEHYGEDILQKIETVQTWVAEELAARGVENPNISSPVFLVENDNGESLTEGSLGEGGHYSLHGYITVDLNKSKRIEYPQIKQLEMLALLAHETYHSVAQISMRYDEDNNIAEVENIGAGYMTDVHNQQPNALEEGLATSIEFQIKKKILDNLVDKEESDLYKYAIEQIRKHNEMDDSFPDEAIRLSKLTNEGNLSFGQPSFDYMDSYKLVNFLKESIPNFDTLIEKTRCERRSLDLARAIEETFGEGYYRKVTTALASEAKELLEELQQVTK